MRVRVGTLVVLGLLAATSACSGGSSGPMASPSPRSPALSATPPATPSATPSGSGSGSTSGASALTIVVEDGSGTRTWTLTCDPVGGSHPDPQQACAALEAHRSALQPVAKDKMCAQVYGGPEKATITGSWHGEQVFASLSRVNSCETARWDALVPLVPAGGS